MMGNGGSSGDTGVPSPPLEMKLSWGPAPQHPKTHFPTVASREQRPTVCATSLGTHRWCPDLGERSRAKQPPTKIQWDALPT